MKNLTTIDKQILSLIAERDMSIPNGVTKEQYNASIQFLAESGLVNALWDMGNFLLDAIITNKGRRFL